MEMVVISEIWEALIQVILKGWLQSFITFSVLYVIKRYIFARCGCEKVISKDEDDKLNQDVQDVNKAEAEEGGGPGGIDIEMDRSVSHTEPLLENNNSGSSSGSTREQRRALRKRYRQHTKPYRCCKSDPKVVQRYKKKAVVVVAVKIARKAVERNKKAVEIAQGTYQATILERVEKKCLAVFPCCKCCRTFCCDGEEIEWWKLKPKLNKKGGVASIGADDENQVVEFLRGAPFGSKDLVNRALEEVKKGTMKPAQYAIITKALLRAAERAQVRKNLTRITEVEEKDGRSDGRNGRRNVGTRRSNSLVKKIKRKEEVVEKKSTNTKMKTNNSIGNQKETAKKKAVDRNRNKAKKREANRILTNVFKSSKYVVGASKK